MRMSIRGRHLDVSGSLTAYAERRLQFTVGAFAPRVTLVDVRVADVNGPKGGVDKHCAIALVLRPAGRIAAAAIEADAYAAIDRAATRVRAALVRRLARQRDLLRRDAVRSFTL